MRSRARAARSFISVDRADKDFMSALGSVVVEGSKVLQLSLLRTDLLCLLAVDETALGSSAAKLYEDTGRSVCQIKVGSSGLAIVRMFQLAELCSGLCHSRAERGFLTLLARSKNMAFFPIPSQVSKYGKFKRETEFVNM